MKKLTTQDIIDLMNEAKAEQEQDTEKLKSDIKTGNSDPENYEALRSIISERFAAKMEILEKVWRISF